MSSDKTEQPTAKRKRDARRDGNLARSVEIVLWAQMLAELVGFTNQLFDMVPRLLQSA